MIMHFNEGFDVRSCTHTVPSELVLGLTYGLRLGFESRLDLINCDFVDKRRG